MIGSPFRVSTSESRRVYRTRGASIFAGPGSPYFWVPLLAIASQSALQLPAGPGVDFSRAHGTRKVCWSDWGALGRALLTRHRAACPASAAFFNASTELAACRRSCPHRLG